MSIISTRLDFYWSICFITPECSIPSSELDLCAPPPPAPTCMEEWILNRWQVDSVDKTFKGGHRISRRGAWQFHVRSLCGAFKPPFPNYLSQQSLTYRSFSIWNLAIHLSNGNLPHHCQAYITYFSLSRTEQLLLEDDCITVKSHCLMYSSCQSGRLTYMLARLKSCIIL